MTAANILEHPLLGLLFDLAYRGVTFRTRPPRTVIVSPTTLLTETDRARLRAEPDIFYLLALLGEDETGCRTTTFARELERARVERRPPILQVRRDVPYEAGRCYSCGDALPSPRFGTCLRCALARRLATGAPIPENLATALERPSTQRERWFDA